MLAIGGMETRHYDNKKSARIRNIRAIRGSGFSPFLPLLFSAPFASCAPFAMKQLPLRQDD